MKAILFIAIGGSLGALCRWGLAGWIDQTRGPAAVFPLGIFVANILGCLLFGFLYGWGENRAWFADHHRLALFTGFLGSFTTFSTFSWNTLELLKAGQMAAALLNVALSVVLGLLSVWGGYNLANAVSTG